MSASMAKGSIRIPGFSVLAGQAPEADASRDGAMVLRPWQRDALAALRGEEMRLLISPTGSGKSTLIKALAHLDLVTGAAKKIVIAVPQGIIASSFEASELIIDGTPVIWAGGRHLINQTGSIAEIATFLRSRPARGKKPILVCTHAALVAAHKRLGAATHSPWAGVSLFIDETHHARADGTKAASNRLGDVVAHYLEARPGRLLLTTATFMRSELDDIIPAAHKDSFARFEHRIEDHLRAMVWLKRVSFRFLIGPVVDSLAELYRESAAAKTIVYLPHVGAQETKDAGGKHGALAAYKECVGQESPSRGGAWATDLVFGQSKIRSLDLVTVEGRRVRQKAFLGAISDGQAAIRAAMAEGSTGVAAARVVGRSTPSVVWALNLGREGFDWPELQRVVCVGARGSVPEVLQMIGRLLRDHPGKSAVEFNVLLPHDGGELDLDQVKLYLTTILASMVVEMPFRLRKLNLGSSDERDPREDVRLLGAVIDRAMKDPAVFDGADDAADDAVIRDAVSACFPDASEPRKGAEVERLREMFSARSRAMATDAASLRVDIGAVEGTLGCLRTLGVAFRPDILSALREATRDAPSQWASLEDTRAFCQGKTGKQYDASRPVNMPHSARMPHVHGMTYKDVCGGSRNAAPRGRGQPRCGACGKDVSKHGRSCRSCVRTVRNAAMTPEQFRALGRLGGRAAMNSAAARRAKQQAADAAE